MVIVMEHTAAEEHVQKVIESLVEAGYDVHRSSGVDFTVLGAVGVPHKPIDPRLIEVLPGVREVIPISEPYKLASRTFKAADTVVDVAGVPVGGPEVIAFAGPCSIESPEQVATVARAVATSGARVLRGGAFKPRTSPYSFQGLGEEGLKIMAQVREETGLPIVTEIMSEEEVELVASYADMLQIGARNVQNYALLKAVGQTRKPVLLKRGFGTRIKDFVMSAEYVMAGGNTQVVLCERGITTFEDSCRNTTDINAVPVLKKLTHLPVVLDPSHATGKSEYVPAVARAALAAGCDGLIIEMHPDPAHAASDGAQSLNAPAFAKLMDELRRIAAAVDKTL